MIPAARSHIANILRAAAPLAVIALAADYSAALSTRAVQLLSAMPHPRAASPAMSGLRSHTRRRRSVTRTSRRSDALQRARHASASRRNGLCASSAIAVFCNAKPPAGQQLPPSAIYTALAVGCRLYSTAQSTASSVLSAGKTAPVHEPGPSLVRSRCYASTVTGSQTRASPYHPSDPCRQACECRCRP